MFFFFLRLLIPKESQPFFDLYWQIFSTTEKTDIKDGQVFIWRTWSEQCISCQPDSLSLSVSHFTPSISTNLMRENSTGALQVHPFFIWRLTTLASSSLDWDPVLSQKKKKCCKEEEREGRRRLREGGGERKDGEREVESRSVGGECVYASACETWKKMERETEMEREMENRQSGWRRKRKREYIASVSGIFTNFFFFFFAGSNFR